jgi:hypothetical protein
VGVHGLDDNAWYAIAMHLFGALPGERHAPQRRDRNGQIDFNIGLKSRTFFFCSATRRCPANRLMRSCSGF